MQCEIKYARVRHGYARIGIDGLLKLTIPNKLRFDEDFKSSLIEKGKKLVEKYNKKNLNKIKVLDQNNVLIFGKKVGIENISGKLEDYLEQKALEFSYPILEKYSTILGKKYTKLTIRKMKSKWGSCSHDNKIVINQNLVHLPLKYLEYVCIHEACHMKQKNHSKDFWNLVEAFLPDYKQTKKELKSMILQ